MQKIKNIPYRDWYYSVGKEIEEHHPHSNLELQYKKYLSRNNPQQLERTEEIKWKKRLQQLETR